MAKRFGDFLDAVSEFLAARKGLLPLVGLFLILVNLVLQFVPSGFWGESDLLLHLGVIVAILGIMLSWAL
jgi:hypothetical protein